MTTKTITICTVQCKFTIGKMELSCYSAHGSIAVLIEDVEVSDLLSEVSRWDGGAPTQRADHDFLLGGVLR